MTEGGGGGGDGENMKVFRGERGHRAAGNSLAGNGSPLYTVTPTLFRNSSWSHQPLVRVKTWTTRCVFWWSNPSGPAMIGNTSTEARASTKSRASTRSVFNTTAAVIKLLLAGPCLINDTFLPLSDSLSWDLNSIDYGYSRRNTKFLGSDATKKKEHTSLSPNSFLKPTVCRERIKANHLGASQKSETPTQDKLQFLLKQSRRNQCLSLRGARRPPSIQRHWEVIMYLDLSFSTLRLTPSNRRKSAGL